MAANNIRHRRSNSIALPSLMIAVVAMIAVAITVTMMMGPDAIPVVDAFAPPSSISTPTISKSSQPSSTQLYIIGPLIRKMQGKDQEQNMPMMDADEARTEAPGLRVGASAWKWPPVWPYDANFFKRDAEITAAKDKAAQNNPMGALMSGGLPKTGVEGEEGEDGEKKGDEVVFDSLKYWADNEGVKTELDKRVIEKITNHYSFYLQDGMSILELGAAEQSYLPPTLKFAKHIGVGAVQSQMNENPSITKSIVVDLNHVKEDEGLASKEFDKLVTEEGEFDAIIMANTIDFLNHPREVFKSSWRALKPGGIMIVPFLSKDAYVDKFNEAFTKQWRDMSDDQHMWVAGSFFQFSAGEGWEGLKGFDISPPGSKKIDDKGNPILDQFKSKDGSVPPGTYVVQARKKSMPMELSGDEDVEEFIKSRLWMMPTLEDRDKKLVVPRLVRAYETLDNSEGDRMIQHLDSLPKIYASLIKMDQFAFTFSMQAQLAANLVGDPDFDGNDLQINNMKMGLGLRKPSKDFWAPVGKLTAAMTPEDKVNLLAYIVPRFGKGDAAQDQALDAFVSGLEPTFAVIRNKCPSMTESDVQLLGSELLASEVLKPGRSTREEFAAWLGALTDVDMEFILAKRKAVKEEAAKDLTAFQEQRDVEEKRVEERREKIREQVEDARENRSVFFNARTGKFEEIEQRNDFMSKLPFSGK